MTSSTTAVDSLHLPCKVCGEKSHLLCDNLNEHGEVRTIHSYRCSSCGLVFVGNHLTIDDLGKAYATLDWDAYYDETGEQAGRKFAGSLANLERLKVSKDDSILDVGTGNGDFLLRAKELGYKYLSAHEIPGHETAALDAAGIPVYRDFDFSSVPTAKFDVVTLMDVMEHVLSPPQVMEEVFRMLRPGGIVYFHTPCVTPLDRVMHLSLKLPGLSKIGRAWQRSRTSIFHLQNYSSKSIAIILKRAGFSEISIQRMNELSWPVDRYVRVYACEKMGIPQFLAPILVPLVYPIVGTALFNSNKGVVWARKPRG